MADFETQRMTPGSLLLVQPGQVRRFGDLSGCDGWLLVFKVELLPSLPAGADPRSNAGLDKALVDLVPRSPNCGGDCETSEPSSST